MRVPDWPDVTRVVWCGGRQHLLRVWIGPDDLRIEMDPHACNDDTEAILAALAGTIRGKSPCASVVSVARRLIKDGMEPHTAIHWAASDLLAPPPPLGTGLPVDPSQSAAGPRQPAPAVRNRRSPARSRDSISRARRRT
jgi:hypothetical protein